ncbi:hypothetical protein GCM10010404_55400 [Nonomuraea africana]|uniref:Uncharacterized protein n=1 Tax=Nonomuraea africana TaxID=46171 RepID=A0ABR9KU31_9ACTN|nr:hypothetical protein [Nonomuraea africana]
MLYGYQPPYAPPSVTGDRPSRARTQQDFAPRRNGARLADWTGKTTPVTQARRMPSLHRVP